MKTASTTAAPCLQLERLKHWVSVPCQLKIDSKLEKSHCGNQRSLSMPEGLCCISSEPLDFLKYRTQMHSRSDTCNKKKFSQQFLRCSSLKSWKAYNSGITLKNFNSNIKTFFDFPNSANSIKQLTTLKQHKLTRKNAKHKYRNHELQYKFHPSSPSQVRPAKIFAVSVNPSDHRKVEGTRNQPLVSHIPIAEWQIKT